MMIENEGENKGVQGAADTSQVSKPETETVQTKQAGETAESLKPDKDIGPVPYERFKEVNEKNKTIEKEYQEYKTRMAAYEKIDEVVNSDPVFNKAMNRVITDYNDGRLTLEQAQDKIDDIKTEAGKETSKQAPQQPEVSDEIVQINKTLYQNEFNSLATKDYTEPEDLRAIEAATNQILNRMAPNAAKRYQPGVVEKAYKEAKQFLDGYSSRRMSSYVKEKTSETAPPTKSGVSASTEEKYLTREERTRAMAEGLKNT